MRRIDLQPLRLRPIRSGAPAAAAALHARRGVRAVRTTRTNRHARSDPRRSFGRRLDRIDLRCSRARAGSLRRDHRSGTRLLRSENGRGDRTRASPFHVGPPAHRDWCVITATTPTSRSSVGATPGSILHFANGTSGRCCARFASPCSHCRGPTMSMEPSCNSMRFANRPVLARTFRVMPQCGHAPHRDQLQPTLDAMAAFVERIGERRA